MYIYNSKKGKGKTKKEKSTKNFPPKKKHLIQLSLFQKLKTKLKIKKIYPPIPLSITKTHSTLRLNAPLNAFQNSFKHPDIHKAFAPCTAGNQPATPNANSTPLHGSAERLGFLNEKFFPAPECAIVFSLLVAWRFSFVSPLITRYVSWPSSSCRNRSTFITSHCLRRLPLRKAGRWLAQRSVYTFRSAMLASHR